MQELLAGVPSLLTDRIVCHIVHITILFKKSVAHAIVLLTLRCCLKSSSHIGLLFCSVPLRRGGSVTTLLIDLASALSNLPLGCSELFLFFIFLAYTAVLLIALAISTVIVSSTSSKLLSLLLLVQVPQNVLLGSLQLISSFSHLPLLNLALTGALVKLVYEVIDFFDPFLFASLARLLVRHDLPPR